jgi:hypothetical protein
VMHANKPWSRMLHLPEPFVPMSWISILLPYLLAMSLRVLETLWLSLPVASGSVTDTQDEDFLHLLCKS